MEAFSQWSQNKKFFAKYNGPPILEIDFSKEKEQKAGITLSSNSPTRNLSEPCDMVVGLPTVKGEEPNKKSTPEGADH